MEPIVRKMSSMSRPPTEHITSVEMLSNFSFQISRFMQQKEAAFSNPHNTPPIHWLYSIIGTTPPAAIICFSSYEKEDRKPELIPDEGNT